jgi:(p)ppGpp synthase/HD superfamily hydrolase
MVLRSAGPTEVLMVAAERRLGRSERATHADRAASDPASSLRGSALAFTLRCHAGQRRTSDGAPFIEHPLEVARLLRSADCSDVLGAIVGQAAIGPRDGPGRR